MCRVNGPSIAGRAAGMTGFGPQPRPTFSKFSDINSGICKTGTSRTGAGNCFLPREVPALRSHPRPLPVDGDGDFSPLSVLPHDLWSVGHAIKRMQLRRDLLVDSLEVFRPLGFEHHRAGLFRQGLELLASGDVCLVS